MKIYAHTDWVVGEPYTFNKQHNGLIINNEETDNVLKVISSAENHIAKGDILMYNTKTATKYIIGGKTYIAVNIDDIVALIDLDEGEENNG